MNRVLENLPVFLHTIQILKGCVTEFIKWLSRGIITNISNLKAPEKKMSELNCQKRVDKKHCGERESGIQLSIFYKS